MDAVICPDNVTEKLLCVCKLYLYFLLDFLYMLNNFA